MSDHKAKPPPSENPISEIDVESAIAFTRLSQQLLIHAARSWTPTLEGQFKVLLWGNQRRDLPTTMLLADSVAPGRVLICIYDRDDAQWLYAVAPCSATFDELATSTELVLELARLEPPPTLHTALEHVLAEFYGH